MDSEGRPLLRKNIAKLAPPFQKCRLPINIRHSVLAVTPSEKSSINTNRNEYNLWYFLLLT